MTHWNADGRIDEMPAHLAEAEPPSAAALGTTSPMTAASAQERSCIAGSTSRDEAVSPVEVVDFQREIARLQTELAAQRARAEVRIDELEKQLEVARETVPASVWLSALFLMSRIVVLLLLAGQGTDLQVHREYVARIIDGELPFRDFIPEYPPLMLVFTLIPSAPDQSLELYFPLFRGLCCLVDCGMWALLLGQLRRGRTGVWQLVLYLLGTTMLGALLYDRIDIVLAAMLLVAAISLRDGRDERFHLAIGLGIAFKLIPVVLAPLALAFEWTRKDRRPFLAALRIALPTLISFAIMAGLGGHRFDEMFAYHLHRGIQIESLPASFEMFGMMFGMEGEVSNEFGCDQLSTAWEQPLGAMGTVLLGLVVMGSAVFAIRRKLDKAAQMHLLAAVLSSALLCSKVLSPQYFIFLLPVLVTLPVAEMPSPARRTWILIALLFVLTGVIYPWVYASLVELHPLAQGLVVVRNACMAALCIRLIHRAWVLSGAEIPLPLRAAHPGEKAGRVPYNPELTLPAPGACRQ